MQQQAANYGGGFIPEQGPLTYGNPPPQGYRNQNPSLHGMHGVPQLQFISPHSAFNLNSHMQTPQRALQPSHQMLQGPNVEPFATAVDHSPAFRGTSSCDYGSDTTDRGPQMMPVVNTSGSGVGIASGLSNRPYDGGLQPVASGDKPKNFGGTTAKRRDRIRKFAEDMNESFQNQRSHCAVLYLQPSETGRVACHLVASEHLVSVLQPALSQNHYKPLVDTIYGTVPFVGAASRSQAKAKAQKQFKNPYQIQPGSLVPMAQADRAKQAEMQRSTASTSVIDVGCSPISENSLPVDEQGLPEARPANPKRKRSLQFGLESYDQASNMALSASGQCFMASPSMTIPVDQYVQSVVDDTLMCLERPNVDIVNVGDTTSQQLDVNTGRAVSMSTSSNVLRENNGSSTTADVLSMARQAVEEEAPESDGYCDSDCDEDREKSFMIAARGNCFNGTTCNVNKGTMVLLDLGKEYSDHWPLVGRVKTIYVDSGCAVTSSTKLRIEWMESAADNGSEPSKLAIDGKWHFWKSPSGRIYEGTYAVKKHYLCNFQLTDGRLPEKAKRAVNMQLSK